MNNAPVWDSKLISTYNLTGPRYTSYPTALQFKDSFDYNDFIANSRQSAIFARPLSLYFHIPFCSHACFYCACNKIVTKNRERSKDYLERLFQEIELKAELFTPRQSVEQLHFGGGTPTFLDHYEIQALMGKIRQHFNLSQSPAADFSIELDPRETSWPTMAMLRDQGFNRVSIGVQDLNENVQRAINRVQPESVVQSVVDASRTMAFDSIHMDLIYGLPLQTTQSFMETIDRVIDMQPDRLSVFNYAHLPHRFMPQRRINESDLPSPEIKLEILQHATEKLTKQGYVYIGLDHFALPDDKLAVAQEDRSLHRNFQGYTTHKHCDLVGFGISSISKVGNTYAQNTTNEETYAASLEMGRHPIAKGLAMNSDDIIRQEVISQLICHFELDPLEIENQFNIEFDQYFARELDLLYPMSRDGLLDMDLFNKITVSPKGKLLIRNICMAFDKYLTNTDTPRFSKLI